MNKSLGQVMTPSDLAARMVRDLIKLSGSVLEPSAGTGVFLDLIPHAVGVEIDDDVVQDRHRERVKTQDFFAFKGQYDTVIGNPPYVCTKGNVQGKVVTHRVKNDTKSALLPISANLYLRFIERALSNLTERGEMIFVVPIEFFHRTSGRLLREHMLKHGAFTDVWFNDALTDGWDASVEICVFRWQAGDTGTQCTVDGTERYVVERNGCVFFPSFKPVAFIDDFFRATAGARPRKRDMVKQPSPDRVEFGGAKGSLWCSMADEPNWPRRKKPLAGQKILFDEGPTRKKPYFSPSDLDRFVSCALIPKEHSDTVTWAKFLDDYTAWDELTLRVGGRWRAGPNLVQSAPLREVPDQVKVKQ